MIQDYQPVRLRFEAFELDVRTYELRKNGQKVRLQDQPARLLTLLASHKGELVTRGEIQKALWGEDQFVEFEHAINTAVRKIREVLEDDAEKPRVIETLPRKGYRFIAPVEEIYWADAKDSGRDGLLKDATSARVVAPEDVLKADSTFRQVNTASKPSELEMEDSFALPVGHRFALASFLLIQFGYLAMYCALLYYVDVLEDSLIFAGLTPTWLTLPVFVVIAMCGIAVRIYLTSAVGWGHPAAGLKFRRLFPALLLLDGFWATSPLLATRALGTGIALAGIAGLAYLPFAQRTLMRSLYRPDPVSR